jgi:hypothetical protein
MDEEKYKEMTFEYFSKKYKKAVEEITENYGIYFNDIFKIDKEVKELRYEVKILRVLVERILGEKK